MKKAATVFCVFFLYVAGIGFIIAGWALLVLFLGFGPFHLESRSPVFTRPVPSAGLLLGTAGVIGGIVLIVGLTVILISDYRLNKSPKFKDTCRSPFGSGTTIERA